MDLSMIYKVILKNGIREYKFKNSKLKPADAPEETTKGSIFGYRSKTDMINARGVVLTSLEAVKENRKAFTHWTPNIYRYGAYSDQNRRITRGHSENNLRQINTFYIDFDIKSSEEMSTGDILTAALDLGFMPTMILKSDKGYQAYFVLQSSAYVTAASNFKVIKIAKEISQNLRNYFSETLPVDLTCNHFGIARMPRADNVEFFNADYCYSFQEWIDWSMKQSDFTFTKKQPNLTVISGSAGIKQINEPWYKMLMNETSIKGTKALMGRNNVLFTLALANYSSGVSQSDCEIVLNDFNVQLAEPVHTDELLKLIASAYSGKYEAASRDYILLLCKAWVKKNLTSKDLFIRQAWKKFKKARQFRKNSHLHEWKADIMAYLQEQGENDPFLQTSKKAIREAISIPERSLDKVLKVLKDEKKIFLKIKAGRNGGIRIASVRQILLSVIQVKKERQKAYFENIAAWFNATLEFIQEAVKTAQNSSKQAQKISLFEVDTG